MRSGVLEVVVELACLNKVVCVGSIASPHFFDWVLTSTDEAVEAEELPSSYECRKARRCW